MLRVGSYIVEQSKEKVCRSETTCPNMVAHQNPPPELILLPLGNEKWERTQTGLEISISLGFDLLTSSSSSDLVLRSVSFRHLKHRTYQPVYRTLILS